MNRRQILLSGLALGLLPGAASAAKLSLAEISRYLNGIQTAEGAFTQINADGTISTGRVFIKRPGRIRFEYDPPEKALVMAGGGMVAIFDGKSNQPPEQYPLSRTPLSIILDRTVDLSRARMVIGHDFDGTSTTVTAQDPDHPDYGTLKLVFTGNPVELRQWVVTDGAGYETTVVLGEMRVGGDLSSTLFNIPYEEGQRKR